MQKILLQRCRTALKMQNYFYNAEMVERSKTASKMQNCYIDAKLFASKTQKSLFCFNAHLIKNVILVPNNFIYTENGKTKLKRTNLCQLHSLIIE